MTDKDYHENTRIIHHDMDTILKAWNTGWYHGIVFPYDGIGTGTMSSVFDSNKPVTNCFDDDLTATGNFVCKTQGSEKSWAQFVLNRRTSSALYVRVRHFHV